MRFSRLLELIQTFSPAEKAQFRLFLASPYFVSEKKAGQLIALLDIGLVSLERSRDAWPDNAGLSASLVPRMSNETGKLGKRVKLLYQLATQFMIVEQMRKPENEPDNQIVLTADFQRRGLFEQSEVWLCATRKQMENSDMPPLRRFKINELEMNQMILHPTKKSRFIPHEGFQAAYLQYQTMKLDLAIATKSLHNRHTFMPTALIQYMLEEEPFFEEMATNHPLLYLSSRFVSLESRDQPDLEQYGQFEQTIRRQEHLFALEDVKRVWAMARNILLHWWIKTKNLEILRLYFNLALENLANGHLYYHGVILHHTLESVCSAGLELNEKDWVFSFLQEHKGRIAGESDEESFFCYNLARYHFYMDNYNVALDLLPCSMPDPSGYLGAKILEIQILYELESKLLPFRVDAFRVFLRRGASRICSPERNLSIRLFINALTRLQRCPNGNAHRANVILAQIAETPIITMYHWLLKKAAQKSNKTG